MRDVNTQELSSIGLKAVATCRVHPSAVADQLFVWRFISHAVSHLKKEYVCVCGGGGGILKAL